MPPAHSYEEGQILASFGKIRGTPAADITPATYGAICAAIMSTRCVASVGIHCKWQTGAVDAIVELNDGAELTVHVMEARAADPVADLGLEIRDAIGGIYERVDFAGDEHGALCAISDSLAIIIHERDVKIADLEARLVSIEANLTAKDANLKFRLQS